MNETNSQWSVARLRYVNVILRGISLAARFGLAAYLSQLLGLADLGRFGLISGIVGAWPVICGFGISYYMTREMVDVGVVRAGSLLRDRLLLVLPTTLGGALLLWGICQSYLATELVDVPIFKIGVLLVSESVSFEACAGLIAMRAFTAANVLLFIRSALWVFPLMALAMLSAAFRTLDYVLTSWMFGQIAAIVALGFIVFKWPITDIATTPVDVHAIRAALHRAKLTYFSDLGIAGQLYIERYVLTHILGVQATGLYMLYWSVINGVTVLTSTGVAQIATPELTAAFKKGDERGWLRVLRTAVKDTLTVGFGIGAASAIFSLILLPRIGLTAFGESPLLYLIMLVAGVLRLVSELFSHSLASRRLDSEFALVNIFGVLSVMALAAYFSSNFGLMGIGVAGIASAGALLVMRSVLLFRHHNACLSRVNEC